MGTRIEGDVIMTRRLLCLWTIAASLLALALVLPAAAIAAGCGCSSPSPPTCCKAPTPPSPPTQACCGTGGNNINVPGVNVYVSPSVIVNASASANVTTGASATGTGSGSASTVVLNSGGGGGGGGWSESSGSSSLIQGLNVDSGARTERSAYQATRTKVRIVVIQAVCLDDKDVPHPASQVTPDRELSDHYEGEVYRCIAGARMQWTLADYLGKVDFSRGQTTTCNKSEALVLSRTDGQDAGRLQCLPQKPARDCNERSLLRRFGAGVKILKIITTETYTAYREVQTQTAASSSSFSMSIDGGVGGVAH
jgi:hypothetical protein